MTEERCVCSEGYQWRNGKCLEKCRERKPFFNETTEACQACPKESPMFQNGTCVACPEEKPMFIEGECQSCPRENPVYY
jgi:hypothetical protein